MKRVALIGANGQLGTDIVKVFSKDSFFKILPLTREDIDVTDAKRTEKVLTSLNPDIIINTAAYHRVDEVEDNPEKAYFVNSVAQQRLAQLCESNGWTLVYISTDYVYGLDGATRKKPYRETDAPGPVNIYGLSKLAGEYVTRYICSKHFVVRVCGLFGVVGAAGKGGNFVETMIRLGKEKGAVNVVSDQILTPTYTKNVAENLLELLKKDYYGLYHMTAEGVCSWWEFASEIFRLMKMKVKCSPVSSDMFKTRAKRPHYSVLENHSLKKLHLNKMRDWKESLQSYLEEKGYLT